MPVKGNRLEIVAEFNVGGDAAGVKVLSVPDGREKTVIAYDGLRQDLILDLRHSSLDKRSKLTVHEMPLPLRTGDLLSLDIFVDGSVVEVFANNRCSMTGRI